MYLLYVDESGQAKGYKSGSSEYFVLGGLALHEEDCWPLARSLAAVQTKAVGAGNAALELHASRIWMGREEWSKVSRPERVALIRAVFRHLGRWTAPSGRAPTYFAVAVHKPSFKGRSVIEIAHEQLLTRFDTLLSRLHLGGDSHRSLVIADESSYVGLLQRLAPTWKTGAGTNIGKPLHSMIEVPLFVDSKASALVQAADFVSWATWNYYERLHTEFLHQIHLRFDADGGIQHGLAHMIKGYAKCACAPCESKRTHVVPSVLPARY